MENFRLKQTAEQAQNDLDLIEHIEANFDATQMYYNGDLTMYNGKLYICIADDTCGPAEFNLTN